MGFSLGEIFLFIIVGIIVVGPKRLPGLMRTAGQYVARLRRMSTDLRSQSGIDDILRQEGLEQHIHELRSLSRLNMVDTFIAPAASPLTQARREAISSSGLDAPKLNRPNPGPLPFRTDEPLRSREYPLAGCDAYGALPDDAAPYDPYLPLAEPASNGALAEPASNGALAEPASNGALAEPASNGALAEPASNGALAEPASNGALTEPASNGALAEPASVTVLVEPAPAATLLEPVPITTLIEPASPTAPAEPEGAERHSTESHP